MMQEEAVVEEKYDKNLKNICKIEEKINEIPFSSEKMRMSVVYRNYKNGTATSYVKGSPDVLLDLCTQKQIGENVIPFSEEEKQKARNSYNAMSKQALRVLAFAERDLSGIAENILTDEADKNLIWVGMMGMIDPPRTDVQRQLRNA
jgi:Ca2+-transporting ATPase